MPERTCFSCHQPIHDQYLLQIGTDRWHEQCMKCHVCRTTLRESCYRRDGKLLCKDDYQRLFGIKCSVCNQHVPSQELVMRVLGNIYHIRCFLCSICGHPLQKGDQFIIRNGRLICSMDFERETMTYQQCMAFCPPMNMDEMVAGDENILLIAHPHTANETARRGPKRPRTILTSHQRRAFKSSFEVSAKPCRKVRESLANDLGLSVRVVQVWFQNQRAKIKKLQRRQQQTEQKQSKSTDDDQDKDAVDTDDTSSDDSDPADDEDVLNAPTTTELFSKLPASKKKDNLDRQVSTARKKKSLKAVKPGVYVLQSGEKADGNCDGKLLCDGGGSLGSVNPYSLDSMTSFSFSPEDSVACDLSCGSSLHDLSSEQSKTIVETKQFGSTVPSGNNRKNPIDSLYSMQASYFDV